MTNNKDDYKQNNLTKCKCNLCKKEYDIKEIEQHINSCLDKKNDNCNVKNLYYFVVKAKSMGGMFLHLLISQDSKLADLDQFLRDIWLECCNHPSLFKANHQELDKKKNISILTKYDRIDYIYDFNFFTELEIKHIKTIKGEQNIPIKILARNPKADIKCHICNKAKAHIICSECYNDYFFSEDEDYLFCEECAKKHKDKIHNGNSDFLTYLENSPRAGICNYGIPIK